MQGRSSIHYGVFLVAGVLVSGIALLTVGIGNTDNPEAMQLFAGIGGVFILIGIAKWIAKKIKDVKEGETALENRMTGGVLQETAAPKPTTGKKTILTCSRCTAKNYSTSNYCHMCGLRLR